MAGNKTLTGKLGKTAVKMLKKVCEILEKNDVPYVLEAGTLLGIVRENRLLPWDNDLDITITSKNCEKLLSLRWKFWLSGYRTRLRKFKKDVGPFKKGMPRILKVQTRKFLFFKDYSLLDIFIKYNINGEYNWIISDKKPVLKKTPLKFYDQKTQYEFAGHKFFVPKDYTGYLAYHYGENWRTPIRDWNFRTDDHCDRVILD